MKSYSQISYNSFEEPAIEPSSAFLREMSIKLEQASKSLSFQDFQQLFINLIKTCIKKAQVDITFNDGLFYIQKWCDQYVTNIQLLARIFLLEALKIYRDEPAEAVRKLNRTKHLVIDTKFEYLVMKIFVVEAKIAESTNDKEQQLKILKKCIEYGEKSVIEFLKEKDQIRIEIADNMIIAYLEMFKIYKDTNSNLAINFLSKAYQAAQKNYGIQHYCTNNLYAKLQQQQKLMIGIDKISTKALTQIVSIRKKHTNVLVQYSWQEELLVAQLTRKQQGQNRLIKESSLNLKLDMVKIKTLQNHEHGEWLYIRGNQINIMEEEVQRIVDEIPQNLFNQSRQVNNSKNLSLKQISRDDVFRRDNKNKDSHDSSSSEDNEDIILPNNENFLKYYRKDKQVHSRSKSRDSRH